MKEGCAQNMIMLITMGLKILWYFYYLLEKYESSCRFSFKSQIDGVK
jgi:hypothetical protein